VSGVGGTASPGELWRAALEAVTAQAGHIHAAMSEVAGDHRHLVVTGGWARSVALLAVKRRVLGELRTPAAGEAGARGAALLAGQAAGLWNGPAEFPAPDRP
jgi:glycerol kinase